MSEVARGQQDTLSEEARPLGFQAWSITAYDLWDLEHLTSTPAASTPDLRYRGLDVADGLSLTSCNPRGVRQELSRLRGKIYFVEYGGEGF